MTETPEKFLTAKIQHTLKRLITLRTCRLFLFKHALVLENTLNSLQGPVHPVSSLKMNASWFFLVMFSFCYFCCSF